MIPLWDVHAHLPGEAAGNVEGILQRAREHGVAGAILNGCDPASNRRVLDLCARFPGRLFPAFGLHPEREDIGAREWGEVLKQIEEHRREIVALGEVGLPYYSLREKEGADRLFQGEMRLATLLGLAQKWGHPVVLHAPHERAARVLDLLGEFGIRKALFHWHKAPEPVTEAIISGGFSLSVTPEICYRQRDRELAARVPMAQLLAESDSPWAYGGEFQGAAGEPWMVARVAEEIAAVKGISREETARQLALNAAALFGLPVFGQK